MPIGAPCMGVGPSQPESSRIFGGTMQVTPRSSATAEGTGTKGGGGSKRRRPGVTSDGEKILAIPWFLQSPRNLGLGSLKIAGSKKKHGLGDVESFPLGKLPNTI